MGDIIKVEDKGEENETSPRETEEKSLTEHLASSIDMEVQQLRFAQSVFSGELIPLLNNPVESNLKKSEYPVQYLRGYKDPYLVYEDPEFPEIVLTPKDGPSFNCKEARFAYHITQFVEPSSRKRLMVTSTVFNSAYFGFNSVVNTVEYKQLKKEEEQQTPTYMAESSLEVSGFDPQEPPTAKREELNLSYLGFKFRFSRFVDENMRDHHIELQVEKFNEQERRWKSVRRSNALSDFSIKDFYILKNMVVETAYEQSK